MKPARAVVALVLATLLFALPLAPARASDETSESRIGVLLMVACGLALKAAIGAPVQWAGVAALSCLGGFLDAALSPDDPPAGPAPAP